MNRRLFFVFLYAAMVIVGNAMQIIGLNFWVRSFPHGTAGAFTTLLVSGAVFGLFFAVSLGIYVLRHRPSLDWVLHWRPLQALFSIGFWDGICSWFIIYATRATPEIIQTLLYCLTPAFTLLFTKWLLHDHRSYCSPLVLGSFACMLAGVIVAISPELIPSLGHVTAPLKHPRSHGQNGAKGAPADAFPWGWSLMYLLAIPMQCLYNVQQTQFMRDYTLTESEYVDEPTAEELKIESWSVRHHPKASHETTPLVLEDPRSETAPGYGTAADAVSGKSAAPLTRATSSVLGAPSVCGVDGSDDSTVKLVMLAADTVVQWVVCFMLLPADAIPGFGGSRTIPEAWSNLESGVKCVVKCPNNAHYCILYSIGFIFTYTGSAHLNHFSAVLSSFVGQLAFPMTALLLILVPSLNVNEGHSAWQSSAAAVGLMFTAVALYTVWEQRTAEEDPSIDRPGLTHDHDACGVGK